MSDSKRLIRSVVLGIVDGIAVVALRPDWAQLTRDVTAPHHWLDRVGADQAALTLALAALWCVAVWLAVGLGAIAAAALPGRVGELARRVARRVVPAVVLRAVAGVAGLGVLVAPVSPAVAGAGSPPGATSPAAARLGPAPAWPTDTPGSGPRIGWPTGDGPGPGSTPPRGTPTPTWPSTPNPPAPPSTPNPPSMPAPSRPASSTGPSAEPQTGTDQRVRAKPGDSLWLIAAHRLGADAADAEIAAEWPRWYAANRAVIGDDPSLIEPGQVLHAPPTSG